MRRQTLGKWVLALAIGGILAACDEVSVTGPFAGNDPEDQQSDAFYVGGESVIEAPDIAASAEGARRPAVSGGSFFGEGGVDPPIALIGPPFPPGEIAFAEIIEIFEDDAAAEDPEDAPALSDEQDFDAVVERETIESDSRRRALQKSQRVVYDPVELPERESVSNVARFAIETTHEVGEKRYGRFAAVLAQINLTARCAEFPDDYSAQQAFLDAGGPETDRLLLDPDGDGFACNWRPDFYRQIAN